MNMDRSRFLVSPLSEHIMNMLPSRPAMSTWLGVLAMVAGFTAPWARGQTLTALHSFAGGTDGAWPEAGLVQGSDSNFYGTTYGGGVLGCKGTVFRITSSGTLTTLYSFTGGDDGGYPRTGLIQGSDGNFYGTTYDGGVFKSGTVFRITSSGTLTNLHSFTGGSDGGNKNGTGYPQAGLVQGSDSNYYGTTYGGGAFGYGTVFRITSSGTLTTLYSFTCGNDGAWPSPGLTQGSDSNFYGVALGGGAFAWGTVFRITSSGTLTTLYTFTGGSDGGMPLAALVQGRDGDFYGTTAFRGAPNSGTVFRMTSSGTLTTLYSFTGGTDGGNPAASLIQGSDGNFYGTMGQGGTSGYGTVFMMTSSGTLTNLHSFAGSDGKNPPAALVQGSDGNFYGTAFSGGGINGGTVFKMTASTYLLTLQTNRNGSVTGATNGCYKSGTNLDVGVMSVFLYIW